MFGPATWSLMSSSQHLLHNAEDISVPTLSNRFRLLVVPKNLQGSLFCKRHRIRGLMAGGSLGKLKGFMDLPVDLVFETAMYLAPKDLLQISRLSKQFWSMFASRSALSVWQTVFCNIDLKCFKDLNEIQFASFLYDKFCMACGRITKKCLSFPVLRLRLCRICQTANLVTMSDLQNQYPYAGELITCLPASQAVCFEPEAHLLIKKYLSLKKENSHNFIDNMVQHTKSRQLELDSTRNVQVCEEYYSSCAAVCIVM